MFFPLQAFKTHFTFYKYFLKGRLQMCEKMKTVEKFNKLMENHQSLHLKPIPHFLPPIPNYAKFLRVQAVYTKGT